MSSKRYARYARKARKDDVRLENLQHYKSCPNLETNLDGDDMELETMFPVVGDLLAEISISMDCHLDKCLEGEEVYPKVPPSEDQPTERADGYDPELNSIQEGKQFDSEESVSGTQSIESTSDYSHQPNSIMHGAQDSEGWVKSDEMLADVAIDCDYPIERANVPEEASNAAHTTTSPINDRKGGETQHPVGKRQKYICFASIIALFVLIILIAVIVYTITRALNLGFLMF